MVCFSLVGTLCSSRTEPVQDGEDTSVVEFGGR
jgi:hypothetical protein